MLMTAHQRSVDQHQIVIEANHGLRTARRLEARLVRVIRKVIHMPTIPPHTAIAAQRPVPKGPVEFVYQNPHFTTKALSKPDLFAAHKEWRPFATDPTVDLIGCRIDRPNGP